MGSSGNTGSFASSDSVLFGGLRMRRSLVFPTSCSFVIPFLNMTFSLVFVFLRFPSMPLNVAQSLHSLVLSLKDTQWFLHLCLIRLYV